MGRYLALALILGIKTPLQLERMLHRDQVHNSVLQNQDIF